MKKSTVTLSIAAMTILFVSSLTAKDEANLTRASAVDMVRDMKRLSGPDQMKLLGTLGRDRSELQSALIHQVGVATTTADKIAAAYLLGLYRMPDSARHLVEIVALEDERVGAIDREPLWDRYPVVEALVKIGRPSVQPVLEKLATVDDEPTRTLLIQVLVHVDDPEIARIHLERSLRKLGDAKQKERLSAAIARVHDIEK